MPCLNEVSGAGSGALKLYRAGAAPRSDMHISLDLPEDIAHQLASDEQGLSGTVVEALPIEGVRSGKLSTGQARRLLGFSTRMQVDGFLKEHGVYLPLTIEDVERDAEVSRRFREQWS